MKTSHLKRVLVAWAIACDTAAHAQGDPGMEHCVFPPRLLCPTPKGSLPGSGIPALCEKLVANGITSADVCWDFAWAHTCAELLDLQVRSAGSFGGNCYGVLVTNCCPTPVHIDLSWVPEIRYDHQPAAIWFYANHAHERLEARAHRREVLIDSGNDVHALWIDADDKYNIPGAELRWQVHAIRAVDESPDGSSQDRETARPAEPYPQVAYDSGGEIFETAKRTQVRADRIRHEAGTVSFWIEPKWSQDNGNSADFVQLGNTGLHLVKRGHAIRFEHTNGDGESGDADITDWRDGERHHIVAIWTASSLELYVDGQQAFISQRGGRAPVPGDAALYVGTASHAEGPTAQGRLFSLMVVNHSLPFNDVIKLFNDGARQHN